MTGWIKIHRSMRDHWVFSNPDYFRAWICILMEVNHSDKKTLIGGKLLNCNKGESLKSLDNWGSLFGNWSKNKVYRFFKLLKKENMIELKNETVTTRLTVCNYCKYQETGNASGTVAEHQAKQGAELDVERTRNTNKNDKKEKNEKNDKKYTARDARLVCEKFDWLDNGIWNEWIDWRIKKGLAITERAINANIKKLRKFGIESANRVISTALEKSWKDLYQVEKEHSIHDLPF